jgi:hypothetical protein
VKAADWILDFGREGGDGGGQIFAVGTSEQMAKAWESWTFRHVGAVLARDGAHNPPAQPKRAPERRGVTAGVLALAY